MRVCSIEGCLRRHEARGWCSLHYDRWRRHGDPLGQSSVRYGSPPEERLRFHGWEVDGAGCWNWSGLRGHSGYGILALAGKKLARAHRVAYEVWVGPIPGGMVIMHSCDNQACINPAHLRAGTNDENMADMVAKGRSLRGERSPRSVLNEDKVREIRASTASVMTLAVAYGVSASSVMNVRTGKTWGWMQ